MTLSYLSSWPDIQIKSTIFIKKLVISNESLGLLFIDPRYVRWIRTDVKQLSSNDGLINRVESK